MWGLPQALLNESSCGMHYYKIKKLILTRLKKNLFLIIPSLSGAPVITL